jgi:putative DNA primase/helicase
MIDNKKAPLVTTNNAEDLDSQSKDIDKKVIITLNSIRNIPNEAISIKSHSDVLADLLNEIQEINYRDYLQIPEEVDIKQKHIVVAVIKYLLEIAKAKKWNLCKTYDYTYIYNGAYWQKMDKDDLKKFLGDVALKTGCQDYESRHYEFKDKLLKQFLTEAHLPKPEPNPNIILINLINGTFEFTANGGKIRPFNPNDFLTYQLQFNFDPNAKAPKFLNYLHTVLPDESSRKVLQEFSGYIFTKINLEKMLMLTGTGANGKSVFFNILTALLGKQNVLTYSLGLFKDENNRAMLVDKLVNYSSEKGNELNPDTLKALVSGEPLQARLKYGNSFTMYNQVRFIVNANELPKEVEQTEAYFRRYLIIPFDVTIPECDRDSELAKKIIETELNGVFNWLLIGLKRIIELKNFSPCSKSIEAINNFKKQSDSVALFIEEFNYTTSDDEKKPIAELYSQYKIFCNDDNYRPVGKNKFSARLENKGFIKTRLSGGTSAYFIDIK